MKHVALDPVAFPSANEASGSPDDWDLVIEPTSGWSSLGLHKLWRFRDLLYFLTWRDIKVRYKQTALGAAWAILQPVLSMVIFTIVFGHFAHIPSNGAPYPLFAYAALVPWTFFAFALSQSANSLVENSRLISKVYFPRLIIPIGASLAGIVDLGIASLVLFGMMILFGVHPTLALLTLPLFVILALAAALAAGTWLSALNVQYRDVRYTVPFLTQIWLFATPVVYPSSLIHGRLHVIFALNPMSGVVEGFRWAILGTGYLDALSLLISTAATVIILVGGLFYFRRMEQRFADVV